MRQLYLLTFITVIVYHMFHTVFRRTVFRHCHCSMSEMIYSCLTQHQKSNSIILTYYEIFQLNRQFSLKLLKTANSFQGIPGFSVTQCQKWELFEQVEADVKYLSLNSNTQRHFSQIKLSAFPLGKKGRKNSTLAPGNHYGNERQKRLKCCDGEKEKKFTLLRWGLLMSLTPPRINSLINMYT